MEMMKNAFGSYMRFSNEEVIACRGNKEKLGMLVENSVAFVKEVVKGYFIGNEYICSTISKGLIGLMIINLRKPCRNNT